MDSIVARVADAVVNAFQTDTAIRLRALLSEPSHHNEVSAPPSVALPTLLPPFLVAVGAPPGCGKTVFASALARALTLAAFKTTPVIVKGRSTGKPSLNGTSDESGNGSGTQTFTNIRVTLDARGVPVVPMDGYHHTRAVLRAMSDPELAFRLRGAPFTFDAARYCADMGALRATGTLVAPSFDHAVGDPVEGAIVVEAATRIVECAVDDKDDALMLLNAQRSIVIVEGLYALYAGDAHWAAARCQFDCLVSLTLDAARCTERLVRRHMAAWGISRDEALIRASGSDAANGVLVVAAAAELRARSTNPSAAAGVVGDAGAGEAAIHVGYVKAEGFGGTTATPTTGSPFTTDAPLNVTAVPICPTIIEAAVHDDMDWVSRTLAQNVN